MSLVAICVFGFPLLDVLGAAVRYRDLRRQDRADLRRIG